MPSKRKVEQETTAEVMRASFTQIDTPMGSANMVDALFQIANSLDKIAMALQALGVNHVTTGMGAIELLAKEVREGCLHVANAGSRLVETAYNEGRKVGGFEASSTKKGVTKK